MEEPPAPRSTRRVTVVDVAAEAGVSRSLVSIVMHGRPGASPANRRRVQEAADRLGYQPDTRARRLRQVQTGLVGVTFGFDDTFHGDMVEALYVAAKAAGLQLALSAVTPTRGNAEAVAALVSERCDALIVLASELSEQQAAIYHAEIPVVLIAGRLGPGAVDTIRTDDVQGGRLAAQHVLDLGHTELGYVDGAGAAGSSDRERGLREVVEALGGRARLRVFEGGIGENGGSRAMRRILEVEPPRRPTAVVAYNDRCALGIVDTASRSGLSVPGDLSVVGYDNSRLARLDSLSLTSVGQDPASLARRAIARIVHRLQDAADAVAVDEVDEPVLVVRTSTARPPLSNPGTGL